MLYRHIYIRDNLDIKLHKFVRYGSSEEYKNDKKGIFIGFQMANELSRVPKKGSFLSNLSKGATVSTSKLTKKEKFVSKSIAKKLKKEGIFFAGIDFISEKLNGDINVTSPTGLKNYFDLTGINLAKKFWKEIKK